MGLVGPPDEGRRFESRDRLVEDGVSYTLSTDRGVDQPEPTSRASRLKSSDHLCGAAICVAGRKGGFEFANRDRSASLAGTGNGGASIVIRRAPLS
jgi:hypothetical protein